MMYSCPWGPFFFVLAMLELMYNIINLPYDESGRTSSIGASDNVLILSKDVSEIRDILYSFFSLPARLANLI